MTPPLQQAIDERDAALAECERLKTALEIERMRLAGCGVAAMQNTEASKAERITKDNPYWSASYGDVCRAVDAEIEARENYLGACETIAKMHAAAVGEITGPIRGVVEDVADVKSKLDSSLAECERLRTRHWTILDDMNKSELDAYDLGCAESIAAVDKILDGKDDGSGTNNEPWYTQRKRLLSLTAECERLRADAERYHWLSEDLDTANGREVKNAILERMAVMSYSAICAAIDAARAKP